VDFANKVPFYGAVIACLDDRPVRELLPKITRRMITYGLSGNAPAAFAPRAESPHVEARDSVFEAFGAHCLVAQHENGVTTELGRLRLNVPGRHNLLNALAAVAVGLETGVPFPRIASALEEFRGAERRFDRRGEADGVMVVDDYGHHPTEIAAVIEAARGVGRRILVVFQPHRFTRTRDLMEEFGQALAAADEVVLTDIYSAGEAPIAGITVERLAQTVRATATCPVHLIRSVEQLPEAVAALTRPGDLVITLGAGSIGGIGDRILDVIRKRPEREPAS
jgi:UDP-N-acetylmuramate--alanine ligase